MGQPIGEHESLTPSITATAPEAGWSRTQVIENHGGEDRVRTETLEPSRPGRVTSNGPA
jgi:hypothetical protein